MKRLNLTALKELVFSTLHANPVEAAMGLCFFAMFVVNDITLYPGDGSWRELTFMFPTLFVVAYSCNYFFAKKRRLFYYLSILTLVPLVIFASGLHDFIDSPAYGFTVLLTVFLLLGHRKMASNASFAKHCVMLFVDAAFALAVGLLFMGAYCIIYFSVIYIFDWQENDRLILYISYCTFYLLVPLYFCLLQRKKSEEWSTLPGGLQMILNYILSPAIIVYTLILYIYFITIAVRWELPKGGVAYMVMAFVIVSLAGRMSQLIVSKKYYEWFYRPFGLIAVPPLMLFWIGSMHRICEYSYTESRVYLLAAGVLMTLYVFLLYSKRMGSYRLMLLISSGAIVLLTYIPGISAHSIGIVSQAHRMERLAGELSMWNDTLDQLATTPHFVAKDSVQLLQARELSACYDYLIGAQGRERVVARYGENRLDVGMRTSKRGYYDCPLHELPLNDYSRFLTGCTLRFQNRDSISIGQGNRILLEENMKAHFAKHKYAMDAWTDKAVEIEPFYLKNDSCFVIIEQIIRDDEGNYKLGKVDVVAVFGK